MTPRERLWIWTRSQPAVALRATGLLASALVSEVSFRLREAPDPLQHHLVRLEIGLRLIGSMVCQELIAKPAIDFIDGGIRIIE